MCDLSMTSIYKWTNKTNPETGKTYTADEIIALKKDKKLKTWRYRSKDMTCVQLAKIAECSEAVMRNRLTKNTPEKAVAMGKKGYRKKIMLEWNGKEYSKKELSKIRGCCILTLEKRINIMGIDRAMTNEKTPSVVLPEKRKRKVSTSNWEGLSDTPRVDIESIQGPTEFELKYCGL